MMRRDLGLSFPHLLEIFSSFVACCRASLTSRYLPCRRAQFRAPCVRRRDHHVGTGERHVRKPQESRPESKGLRCRSLAILRRASRVLARTPRRRARYRPASTFPTGVSTDATVPVPCPGVPRSRCPWPSLAGSPSIPAPPPAGATVTGSVECPCRSWPKLLQTGVAAPFLRARPPSRTGPA